MQILLGRGEVYFPPGNADKIIFVTLIIVSITFTMEIVQQIFDSSFINVNYKRYESIDDILNSNKTFYTDKSTLHTINTIAKQGHDKRAGLLLKKLVLTPEYNNFYHENTVGLMLKTKCNFVYYINYFSVMVEKEINKNDTIVTVLPRVSFNPYRLRFRLFSSQSPYVQKFNALLRRIFESGLSDYCTKRAYGDYVGIIKHDIVRIFGFSNSFAAVKAYELAYNNKVLYKSPITSKNVDVDFHVKLIYFFSFGLLFSIFVFMIEIANVKSIGWKIKC